MLKFYGRCPSIYERENVTFRTYLIEFVARSARFILGTRISYVIASNWTMNRGISSAWKLKHIHGISSEKFLLYYSGLMDDPKFTIVVIMYNVNYNGRCTLRRAPESLKPSNHSWSIRIPGIRIFWLHTAILINNTDKPLCSRCHSFLCHGLNKVSFWDSHRFPPSFIRLTQFSNSLSLPKNNY